LRAKLLTNRRIGWYESDLQTSKAKALLKLNGLLNVVSVHKI